MLQIDRHRHTDRGSYRGANLGTDSDGLESEICTKNFMSQFPHSLKNNF